MTLLDVLQCTSLEVFLQPLHNDTPMNASEHDELRINTCFENGILQPVMCLLIVLIALPPLFRSMASCCGKGRNNVPHRQFMCCSFLSPVITCTLIALTSFGIAALDWMKLPLPAEFKPGFYGNATVLDGTNGTM